MLIYKQRMTHLTRLALLLTLLSIIFAQQCMPLFPRMFYSDAGRPFQPGTVDLAFMFNTEGDCKRSYVTVAHELEIHMFLCTQTKIQTYDASNNTEFVHYVQKCPAVITRDKQINSFIYQAFGSNLLSLVPSESFEVQLPISGLPLRFAVFSDWGPIQKQHYKPLNDTLDYLLVKRQEEKKIGGNEYRITGLILNGDYAYDLESDSCKQYLRFMNELTRVSRFWPIISSVGNHQSTRPKSMYLLENSFVLGGLVTPQGDFSRVQSYRFVGWGTFVAFDPFLQVYSRSTKEQYQAMTTKLKSQVESARRQHGQQFLLLLSHYPVMCSQVDPHCRDAMGTMPDLYNYLSNPVEGKGLVDLYIGSHMHQYERIYPYVSGQFVIEPSPYTRGRLVSVVEAVGGVDYFIIEEYYKPEYFSAYATYNLTGLAILTFTGRAGSDDYAMNYKHYVTVPLCTLVDQFTIYGRFADEPRNGKLTKE